MPTGESEGKPRQESRKAAKTTRPTRATRPAATGAAGAPRPKKAAAPAEAPTPTSTPAKAPVAAPAKAPTSTPANTPVATPAAPPESVHAPNLSADPALAGLCAALLPPEAGGPDPHVVARRMAELAAMLPREVAIAVTAGARAIDLAARLTAGGRLATLPADRRSGVLHRLARVRALAPALDGLKAFVLLAAGADAAEAEARESALANPPVRPDPPLDITPSGLWSDGARADVIVVGSGAGGAMAARTLARAGLDVVIVEEGRRHGVEELRSEAPLRRFATLYRDGGSTAALGVPPVVLPIGRAVGGTTVVNSGTCFTTPRHVLTHWRDSAGLALADPAHLEPYLDEVMRTVQAGPVPLDIMGRNGHLLLEGAKHLGWNAAPLTRNAPGCDGCCQCSVGCPHNAKAGVHLNALPQACEAGARIVSDGRVTRVVMDGARAIGVEMRRPDGTLVTLYAPRIVVAAGTTETPPLLRRSGLGAHPMLGHNMALHPALGVAGRFDEPVHAWHGVLQSAYVDELHETDGILIEATSTPPGMGSMLLPGIGAPLVKLLAESDHLATLGGMIADQGRGRVVGARRTLLLYSLSRRDAHRLVRTLDAMGRLLFAAGAASVITGIPHHQEVHSVRELTDAVGHASVRDLHVAAFHPVGTAAAGSDPERHPVRPDGRLRGVTGVWIADGSVLPTCPEVNPQVSIMALALAIADGIAAT